MAVCQVWLEQNGVPEDVVDTCDSVEELCEKMIEHGVDPPEDPALVMMA